MLYPQERRRKELQNEGVRSFTTRPAFGGCFTGCAADSRHNHSRSWLAEAHCDRPSKLRSELISTKRRALTNLHGLRSNLHRGYRRDPGHRRSAVAARRALSHEPPAHPDAYCEPARRPPLVYRRGRCRASFSTHRGVFGYSLGGPRKAVARLLAWG